MLAPTPGTVVTLEVAWGADVQLLRASTVAAVDGVVRLALDDSVAGLDLGSGDPVLLRWNTEEGVYTVKAVVRSLSQAEDPSIVLELPGAGPERRVRNRTEGHWHCLCAVDRDTTGEGTIIDIGIGGARLTSTLSDVEVGQKLVMKVDETTLGGRIVALFNAGSGGSEMRVRFEDLGLEDLIAIGEMVGDPFPRSNRPASLAQS